MVELPTEISIKTSSYVPYSSCVSKMAFRKENVPRALDSTDPVAIKEARKAQRQALTRWHNALVKELGKKDDSGQLDSSLISEKLVKEIIVKA